MSSAAGVPVRGEIIQIELGQASRQDRQFFTEQSCRALRKPEPNPAILRQQKVEEIAEVQRRLHCCVTLIISASLPVHDKSVIHSGFPIACHKSLINFDDAGIYSV
jgi:hypothetical protein